ncbi:hypothetical protein [Psychrobacillus sp. FSL K6-1267]|uniref:hypothetical protein n=1 Tax=Psychrobacillus sp. FSL K6-1267 TaxID=2921543 RepID=UPI0030F8FF4E
MISFSYKGMGFVFLLSLGFIYSFLRIGQMTGEISEAVTTHIYFKLFFSVFFIISLILFIYGLKKDK